LLIKCIKNYKLFLQIASFNDGIDNFKFSVLSDQDDDLSGPGSKGLRLTVYSLFNISEDRQDFIETLKLDTQYQKDLITLVPDNKEFPFIDKLIGEIKRYSDMEDKYATDSDPLRRQIIRDFSIIREEKEKELRIKIETAYRNASLIYLFDEHFLNPDSFKGTISELQRKLIKNIYTKRLGSGLSDGLVPKIFTSHKAGLSKLFSGKDFKFFDTHGNFTGDHLKVVEEISARIKNKYVDGRTLESDLSGAPWGYSFGTIVSSLAALFRAGHLSVKYNGDVWFSHEQKGIKEAFTNATKFKSTAFKSIGNTLSAAQKTQAVELLMNLDIETHTGRKVDWNTNDFDLADGIRFMADHFITALTTLDDTVDGFDRLFVGVADQKPTLLAFAGKITENNYIEKVEYLLDNNDPFKTAVQTILKAQKFIKKNFSKVKKFKYFIGEVLVELKKAERKDGLITDAHDEFIRLYQLDMVKNFGGLQEQVQIVKDNYYKLIKTAATGMSHEYQRINGKVDAALGILKRYPAELNTHNQKKLNDLKRYCSDRINKEPVLEYSISCTTCGYSLSDILNYTALAPTKENQLIGIQNGFIAALTPPEPGDNGDSDEIAPPKKIMKVTLSLGSTEMTIGEYKAILTSQLQELVGLNDSDGIELKIETTGKEL